MEEKRTFNISVNNAVFMKKRYSFKQLPSKAADELFRQTGFRRWHEMLQRSLRTKFHEDDHLVAEDLHPVVADQMLVLDAFEDAQFIRHATDGFVVIRLQGNLFHGHQLARLIVDRHVHLTEATLTFNIRLIETNKVKIIFNFTYDTWLNNIVF